MKSEMGSEAPDVVVVGLGPAGSRAAAVAADAGYGVVAIERRAEAGCPVQCAEFVPTMIERDVPGVPTVTRQMVARMLTFTEFGSPDETPDFRGRMIDRAAFDRMLAAEAARAGADCRYGQINRALVDTRQLTVPLVLPHDATDIFLSADYRGGYGWLFPKGAVANVGIGVVMEERQRLKPMLTELLARLSSLRRIGTNAFGATGGTIPVGGRLRSIGRLGAVPVMLAGDAAGLTNPVTGAGIASAVQSGTLAGRAAVDWLGGRATAFGDYEEELGDIFDAALGRALRRRREVLTRYQGGRHPDPPALANGWIGSSNYWAA
jgi:digeranylgeranylglycerophospholipid reductase